MKLIVSSPPHWHEDVDEGKLHFNIILALLPAVIFAVIIYGIHAARIITLSITTAVISEFLIRKLFRKKDTILDGSAIIIGILFAMLLSPSTPYWMVIVGSFLCIFIGREIFGGLGCNPLNPVLVGWAITRIAWPAYFDLNLVTVNYIKGENFRYPLTLLKKGGAEFISDLSLTDLLFRQVGSIGAAAILLLFLGGLFLLWRKVITWEIPLSFTIGILFMSFIFWIGNNELYANPLFHLLTGSVILGIFFLSTEYASSPFNRWGMVVFGLGCGMLTIILRAWSNYPDGIVFAIIIMNLFTPLLDKIKKKPKSIKVSYMERGLP